jgi:hypothetical protein
MKILNIHERELEANCEQVGALIDSLASEDDRLWPNHSWPRIQFDRPLSVGADGGHGLIGYSVEEYKPARSIKFHFTKPKGFKGFHRFEVLNKAHQSVSLRHTIEMTLHGFAFLTWPLIIRPLHDALLEDAFATAEASLGMIPKMRAWSPWVKLIRWVISGGKARLQISPDNLVQWSAKNRAR